MEVAISGQASPSDSIFEESDLEENDNSMAGPSGIQEQNVVQMEVANSPANDECDSEQNDNSMAGPSGIQKQNDDQTGNQATSDQNSSSDDEGSRIIMLLIKKYTN